VSPVARALAWVIRGYQQLRAGRPSPCRFTPSCSAYALEAVEVHGAARGSWLAVRRLSRCRPLGGYGVDPVPSPAEPPTHERTVA
jgi:putative membrane protein insertion efficiency factor